MELRFPNGWEVTFQPLKYFNDYAFEFNIMFSIVIILITTLDFLSTIPLHEIYRLANHHRVLLMRNSWLNGKIPLFLIILVYFWQEFTAFMLSFGHQRDVMWLVAISFKSSYLLRVLDTEIFGKVSRKRLGVIYVSQKSGSQEVWVQKVQRYK